MGAEGIKRKAAGGGAILFPPEALDDALLFYYRLTILSSVDSIGGVIKSFSCRETERLHQGRFSRRLPQDIQRIAARKLEILAAVAQLNSLRVPPSNRLEKLKGERSGQYCIRVNDQWRICFVWRDGDAYEVEIVDYH